MHPPSPPSVPSPVPQVPSTATTTSTAQTGSRPPEWTPSPSAQTYKDLLFFEQRLKTNAALLRARARRYSLAIAPFILLPPTLALHAFFYPHLVSLFFPCLNPCFLLSSLFLAFLFPLLSSLPHLRSPTGLPFDCPSSTNRPLPALLQRIVPRLLALTGSQAIPRALAIARALGR